MSTIVPHYGLDFFIIVITNVVKHSLHSFINHIIYFLFSEVSIHGFLCIYIFLMLILFQFFILYMSSSNHNLSFYFI